MKLMRYIYVDNINASVITSKEKCLMIAINDKL